MNSKELRIRLVALAVSIVIAIAIAFALQTGAFGSAAMGFLFGIVGQVAAIVWHQRTKSP